MDKSYFIPLYNQRLGTNTVFSFFLWGLLGKEGRLRVKRRLLEGGIIFGKRKRTQKHQPGKRRRMGFRATWQAFGNKEEDVAVKWDQKWKDQGLPLLMV